MLRKLRRKLAEIQYYSATPRETAWSRAARYSLFLSLVLAIVCAVLCNHLIRRSQSVDQIVGVVLEQEHGIFSAVVGYTDYRSQLWDRGQPYAEFTMKASFNRMGWPVATTERREPAQLDINYFHEAGMQTAVQLPENSPMRRVIENALINHQEQEMLAWWQQGDALVHHLWWGWLFSTVMLWILLCVVSNIGLGVLRVGWILSHRRGHKKRKVRKVTGKCAQCGYDLRGLDFHARCPECGSEQEY